VSNLEPHAEEEHPDPFPQPATSLRETLIQAAVKALKPSSSSERCLANFTRLGPFSGQDA